MPKQRSEGVVAFYLSQLKCKHLLWPELMTVENRGEATGVVEAWQALNLHLLNCKDLWHFVQQAMAAAGWSNYPDCLHWSKSYTDLSAIEGLDGKLRAEDGGVFVRLSGLHTKMARHHVFGIFEKCTLSGLPIIISHVAGELGQRHRKFEYLTQSLILRWCRAASIFCK